MQKDIYWEVVILVLICCCLHYCTTKYAQEDLYGTWEGKNSIVEMTITFDKGFACNLEYSENGQEMIRISGDFEVNFAKKPVPLTIRNISGLNHPLHTIFQFVDSGVIRMSSFATRWRLRPIAFARDTEIILKRVKTE